MSVTNALTRATTTTLNAGTSAANVVTTSLTALDHLASGLGHYAEQFRNNVIRDAMIHGEQRNLARDTEIEHELTQASLVYADRLRDPEYAAAHKAIAAKMEAGRQRYAKHIAQLDSKA